ncbi:protocadherin-16-like, partial [Elysia marginata]
AIASDSDSEKNGELTYSISAGPFSINPSTGAISVAGSLDREQDTSYAVTIQAIDGGDTPRTGDLSLLTSGDASLFTIDTSGVMTVEAGAFFDRLFEPTYELIVDVVDKSAGTKLTFTATVTVTITDVNDQAPYFLSLPSVSKPEDLTIGSSIAEVVAQDDDEGANGREKLIFCLEDDGISKDLK